MGLCEQISLLCKQVFWAGRLQFFVPVSLWYVCLCVFAHACVCLYVFCACDFFVFVPVPISDCVCLWCVFVSGSVCVPSACVCSVAVVFCGVCNRINATGLPVSSSYLPPARLLVCVCACL